MQDIRHPTFDIRHPLKIALVIEHFNPHGGGAERSTAEMARELARRGHHVTILAGHAPLRAAPEGVCVEAMARKRSSSVLRLLRFRRWAMEKLATGQFDVSLSVTMAVPAAVVQPRGGTVRETLDRNIAMRCGPVRQAIKRLCIQLSLKQQVLLYLERCTVNPGPSAATRRGSLPPGAFVAVSSYVAEQLRHHYGVADERITVIPNAAAMPDVDADQRAQWRQRIRQGFHIAEDAVVYLFAAQNPRLKGFNTLIEATRQRVRDGAKPVLLLAGEYKYGDYHHVVEAGVRQHVRWVRQTRMMAPLYAAADVTVLPTFYDPASKVVIESLMMGTPAITTIYNGASDWLTPETPGTPGSSEPRRVAAAPGSESRGLVIDDPADGKALAAAMAELADPAARQRFSDATDGLREELSMARHIDQLEDVLVQGSKFKVEG